MTMGEPVKYELTAVSQGAVSVTDQVVTVKSLPQDADYLTGQTLFLKAVISRKDSTETAVTVPGYVTAKWGDTTGTWISRDTVLFELGGYGSITSNPSGEYSFSRLENGTYEISWSLVYGKEADGNIAGNMVSDAVTSEYTERHVEPSLSVTTETTGRVITAGTAASLAFRYEATSENVSATVEKQGALCEFNSVSTGEGVTVENAGNDQVNVVFTEATEAGTYRICFSSEDSANDNVYFTFIVR